MPISPQVVNEFMSFFAGNDTAYGRHRYGNFIDGKKEEDGENETITDKLLTFEQYRSHLEGEEGQGLGIIPITRENRCKFCVIDVDIYNRGEEQIVLKAIDNNHLPLTIFTTKSGGYHIYLFFSEFVPVTQARELIDRFIRLLSIDILCKNENKHGLEIFPKQLTLKKGQTGSWINLPYYGAAQENNCRQAMLHRGQRLDLEEALVIIRDSKRNSYEKIKEFLDHMDFADAPPCLQSMHILKDVIGQGMRNNYLFSWGVYFNKKNEDNFEENLYKINETLPEPISDKELDATVIQSVRRKPYGYKCTDIPCVSFCNKTECKKREFGVGKSGIISELDFGVLKQIRTTPPFYEWEVNGKFIRFESEDEMVNQQFFRKMCVRELHYMPFRLKDETWTKILNNSLSQIDIESVELSADTGSGATLKRYFYEFIVERPAAIQPGQILLGRVYFDETSATYSFRVNDLIEFIFRTKQFRNITEQGLHGFIRDMGCYPHKTTLTCDTKNTEGDIQKERRKLTIYRIHKEKLEENLAGSSYPVTQNDLTLEFKPEHLENEESISE